MSNNGGMIPDAAVEAAVAAWAKWPEGISPQEQMVTILEAAAPHLMAEATRLIRDLTDSEDCNFDHHGGCQAHGYLDLKIGDMCPQHEAKAWAE